LAGNASGLFEMIGVIAGLDPAIHHLKESCEEDGCAGQARA
jgi:hypothetical protein